MVVSKSTSALQLSIRANNAPRPPEPKSPYLASSEAANPCSIGIFAISRIGCSIKTPGRNREFSSPKRSITSAGRLVGRPVRRLLLLTSLKLRPLRGGRQLSGSDASPRRLVERLRSVGRAADHPRSVPSTRRHRIDGPSVFSWTYFLPCSSRWALTASSACPLA